jgi:hypothetical protein
LFIFFLKNAMARERERGIHVAPRKKPRYDAVFRMRSDQLDRLRLTRQFVAGFAARPQA